MPDIKSVLKPENSLIMGAATVGIVAAIYQLDAGPVSSVHASDPYHPSNTSSIKKAGYTSLIAVAGLALISRDANIVILGGAAIMAFHAHYRHADMTNPETGLIESLGFNAYTPAQYSVSANLQAVA